MTPIYVEVCVISGSGRAAGADISACVRVFLSNQSARDFKLNGVVSSTEIYEEELD